MFAVEVCKFNISHCYSTFRSMKAALTLLLTAGVRALYLGDPEC